MTAMISFALKNLAGCLLLSLPSAAGFAQGRTLAFPGAEGFGATASGGRGGAVSTVSNLNDDGPGSFRDAASRSDGTVVFAVSGVVHLKSNMELGSSLTIAGQTAGARGLRSPMRRCR